MRAWAVSSVPGAGGAPGKVNSCSPWRMRSQLSDTPESGELSGPCQNDDDARNVTGDVAGDCPSAT